MRKVRDQVRTALSKGYRSGSDSLKKLEDDLVEHIQHYKALI
jgi:ribulose bisphosphate carboxylase small subunit